jgi:hypothetical protein
MDHLKEHLLVRDGVHQAVCAQQQVVPGLHGAEIAVALRGDVRAQSPGDEILAGVAAGFLGGDVAPVHHVLHHGVVLGDADDAVLGDVIGPAVAYVAHHCPLVVGDGADQGGTHVAAVLRLLRCGADSLVGQRCGVGGRLPQLLGGHLRLEDLPELLHKGGHRDVAGQLAAGGTAHAVADHADSLPRFQRIRGVGILVVLADQADVGHSPDVHACLSPFLSSISFLRSCPQEASISPPRLRRTVAVTPWDSSRF